MYASFGPYAFICQFSPTATQVEHKFLRPTFLSTAVLRTFLQTQDMEAVVFSTLPPKLGSNFGSRLAGFQHRSGSQVPTLSPFRFGFASRALHRSLYMPELDSVRSFPRTPPDSSTAIESGFRRRTGPMPTSPSMFAVPIILPTTHSFRMCLLCPELGIILRWWSIGVRQECWHTWTAN